MKTKNKHPQLPILRKKKRETRTTIVSFRLREAEAKLLQADFDNKPIAGLRSLKQLCRKLSVDYANGKVVYVDPEERRLSSDSREFANLAPPNCTMSNRRFLRALRDFLNVPENWQKLRFFMLRAGWPADLLAAHHQAVDEQERLLIAQKFLTRMLKKS